MLNDNATKIVEEIIKRRKELKVKVIEQGCLVVDCGINAEGSIEAGRLFSLACMGGLAEIKISKGNFGGLLLDTVEVSTNSPVIACLASQKAGWKIKENGFFAIGSGPARILAKKPRKTFEKIGYSEKCDKAVLALECSEYPPKDVCLEIAEACNVSPDFLYLLVAKTASLAGSVQISARSIETCLHKIDALGYDLKVLKAFGSAPIAPVKGGDAEMMGTTNDMIIYGSKVLLESSGMVEVKNIPSGASSAYGKLFGEIFKEAGYDFYKIDPLIFAPAEVKIKDINTGEERSAGKINPEMIKKSVK